MSEAQALHVYSAALSQAQQEQQRQHTLILQQAAPPAPPTGSSGAGTSQSTQDPLPGWQKLRVHAGARVDGVLVYAFNLLAAALTNSGSSNTTTTTSDTSTNSSSSTSNDAVAEPSSSSPSSATNVTIPPGDSNVTSSSSSKETSRKRGSQDFGNSSSSDGRMSSDVAVAARCWQLLSCMGTPLLHDLWLLREDARLRDEEEEVCSLTHLIMEQVRMLKLCLFDNK